MNTYQSKSSPFVRMATIGALLFMSLASLSLFTNESYGIIGGTVLCSLLLGTAIYLYAASLDRIILESGTIILKKKIGQINIPDCDLVDVQKMGFSSLTMTYGSKGVFGFIGSTMDDSVCLVKDRKNMIQIKTTRQKYVISAEKTDELIQEIKKRYNLI